MATTRALQVADIAQRAALRGRNPIAVLDAIAAVDALDEIATALEARGLVRDADGMLDDGGAFATRERWSYALLDAIELAGEEVR